MDGVLIILKRNSFRGHIKFQEICPGRALMAHIHTEAGDLQIVGVYAQANNDEDPTQPVSSLRAQLWDKIAEAVGPASNVLTLMAGDFNMTELKEHAYRDNVPAGGLSAAESGPLMPLRLRQGFMHSLRMYPPTGTQVAPQCLTGSIRICMWHGSKHVTFFVMSFRIHMAGIVLASFLLTARTTYRSHLALEHKAALRRSRPPRSRCGSRSYLNGMTESPPALGL